MFGNRISLKSLAIMCRSLSTLLFSGVEIRKAFKLAADKTGDARCRSALADVADCIRQGDDVSSAMRRQGRCFPDLLIDMVQVAEGTGMFPEVLNQMADHYDNNLRLRTTFLRSIAWPVFQLVAAIFVIALLIVVLGMIGTNSSGFSMDFLVFGLSGTQGALIWLCSTFGSFFGLFLVYQLLTKVFSGRKFLDPLLLHIPVVGHCLRSFAMARFSWAFYLTQQTGMPMAQSLMASLRATANGAFIAAGPRIVDSIQAGESLTNSLAAAVLFPQDFIESVDVAETSGTVPEALNRLSPQLEDQARRSLVALTTMLGVLVWLLVAGFIVFFIFRFVFWYVGMISEAAKGNF